MRTSMKTWLSHVLTVMAGWVWRRCPLRLETKVYWAVNVKRRCGDGARRAPPSRTPASVHAHPGVVVYAPPAGGRDIAPVPQVVVMTGYGYGPARVVYAPAHPDVPS